MVLSDCSASKWKLATSPFKKFVFLKSVSASVGDVMRDLDGKAFINGDFICVSGDIVSNYPIRTALAKHRARRKKDPNAIMTMVLREAGSEHRTKAHVTSPVFIIDPTTHRCLHYEEMRPKQKNSYLNLDPDIPKDHFEIDIRQDLIDCNIDICTPEVLSLWSDSFDYQSPRKHFLFGVLKDHELNGKTIHTHIIKRHYAARVRSLKAYDSISRDIISRWTYPLCPDTNLLLGQHYIFKKGNIYQESHIALARSCVVHRRTVIGQDSSIGDGSSVSNSVIGRGCQIGKNVTIDGAYIWDDTVIGDGSEIRHAVIANEVFVGNSCIVEPGALISFGVHLAEGTRVSGASRITKAKREGDDLVRSDEKVVGPGGEGYMYTDDGESDDEDAVSSRLSKLARSSSKLILTAPVHNMADLALSDSSISTLSSEVSDDVPAYDGSRSGSFATSISEDDDGKRFHHEATRGLLDTFEQGQSVDVAILELMGLRLSQNASDHQVRHAVAVAFMKRIQDLMDSKSKGASEAVKEVFTEYKGVVERSIFDKNQDQKLDQVDLLILLQRDLIHRPKGDKILLFTAKELYDLEVIEEEGIEQWWASEKSDSDDEMRQVRRQTEQFVQWLANAEEDDSDEEENEDE
jgi:translation initiation factor eIF-2B subunit epsilon